MTDKRGEIDKNFEAFKEMLPSIILEHRNQYALMRHGKIVGYYSTMNDAYTTAETFYDDKIYSIQKVTNVAIDLGYFSHAVHIG